MFLQVAKEIDRLLWINFRVLRHSKVRPAEMDFDAISRNNETILELLLNNIPCLPRNLWPDVLAFMAYKAAREAWLGGLTDNQGVEFPEEFARKIAAYAVVLDG
jgi:hypothetical protein